MRDNYRTFAKFYDVVMGEPHSIPVLEKFILENSSHVKSILELACGTGSVLKYFSKSYEVWGIDISENMLAIAQEKIPHGNFSLQNMTSFTFPQQFDVILCVFDSINHLLNFTDWQQTFKRVSQHLTTDGLFIFDINTITKLKRLIEVPVRVKQFGNNYLIMGTTDAGNNITNWNVKVFEHQEGDMYRMFEENIQEVSFPHTMIQEALQEYFPVVNIVDSNEYPPTVSNVNSTDKRSLEDANRLYFICKNSP